VQDGIFGGRATLWLKRQDNPESPRQLLYADGENGASLSSRFRLWNYRPWQDDVACCQIAKFGARLELSGFVPVTDLIKPPWIRRRAVDAAQMNGGGEPETAIAAMLVIRLTKRPTWRIKGLCFWSAGLQ